MIKQTFLKAALLISLLAPAHASAQDGGGPGGVRFVPDVPGQFRALTERADPLGFHVGGSPNPSHCKHYQAMTRVDGADGTPFLHGVSRWPRGAVALPWKQPPGTQPDPVERHPEQEQ